MPTNPAAASGVSAGQMPSSHGNVTPIAPRTSATPSGRMNHSVPGICFVSSASGKTSFIVPVIKKMSVSSI
jgi:hypothetical protein